MNHGRGPDRIDGWWSKPPQDSGERALVGERKDPGEGIRRVRLAQPLVSLDTTDAFIDALSDIAAKMWKAQSKGAKQISYENL